MQGPHHSAVKSTTTSLLSAASNSAAKLESSGTILTEVITRDCSRQEAEPGEGFPMAEALSRSGVNFRETFFPHWWVRVGVRCRGWQIWQV